jgi:DNA polymerase-3 subunit gamma/tau
VSDEEQPQDQQRSLYRRHRPRTFAEVVGQEPVVRTLRNAVQGGKVHHAYLFVGSRGTGKTSMAKILAACLNCERATGAGTIEPCGVCDSCVSIARATSLDVIEMDAASNNSVDDIRELRESVAYAPVSGRRKVYILDEAHMLSTAAWNAFLKTLEEPPPNTVFVLATTEASKVPATVVDRCHRFDFHRPTVEQIASVVRRTAEAESIEIPPGAIAALARSATGSFRDALGTLEQIVTYSGRQIALEDVLAVLGVADARLLEQTVDAVASGDAAAALRALEECAEQGRDAGSFASDLEVRARELLVVQTLGELPQELSLTPEADAALLAQAERVEHATVVRLLELLGEAMEGVRAGADARTRLELALVKAARPEVDASVRALLARIERLEARTADGNVYEGPPRAAREASAVPDEVAVERRESPQKAQSAAGRAAPVAELQPAAVPGPAPGTGQAAPAMEPQPTATPGRAPVAAPAPLTTPEAAVPEQTPEPTSPPVAPLPATDAREPDATGAPEPAVRDLESVRAVWPAVVELVRGENGLLGAVICEAQPVAVDGEDLTLAFASTAQFLKKKAEDPNYRAAVGEALRAVAGGRWRLLYELRDELAAADRPDSPARSEEEWVARFMREFDAEELTEKGEPVDAQDARADERRAQPVISNEKGA